MTQHDPTRQEEILAEVLALRADMAAFRGEVDGCFEDFFDRIDSRFDRLHDKLDVMEGKMLCLLADMDKSRRERRR